MFLSPISPRSQRFCSIRRVSYITVQKPVCFGAIDLILIQSYKYYKTSNRIYNNFNIKQQNIRLYKKIFNIDYEPQYGIFFYENFYIYSF